MRQWGKEGIPHKGWEFVYMIDLCEDAEHLSLEARKELYETCEMCDQEGIRYVHVMEHPEFEGQLRVGCICAAKMEDDYVAPKRRERELRNRLSRKHTFLEKEWSRSNSGNLTLRYQRDYITIFQDRYGRNCYGVTYGSPRIEWFYKGKKIRNIETAKLLAFDLVDPPPRYYQ